MIRFTAASLAFIIFVGLFSGTAPAAEDPQSLLERAEALARESNALIERAQVLTQESRSLIIRAQTLARKGRPSAEGFAPIQAGEEISQEVRRSLEQEKVRKQVERERQELAVGNVLLPKGHLEIEPSFTYANFSNNNLSIDGFALLPIFVVGLIQSERVRRNVLVPAVTTSYGLLDWLQVELEGPFRYRSDRIIYSDNRERNAKKFGVGDLRLGTAVQLYRYKGGLIPDTIGNLNLFFPTGDDPFDYDPANPRDKDIPMGSGLWSLAGGLTMIKASDPAILFGSLQGTYNFSRDVKGKIISGKVEPGHSLGYAAGVAFAMNYQLTLSLQIQQNFTFETEVAGISLNNSSINDARFEVGGAWTYGQNRSIHFSVGTGLTEDAPDLLIRISTPFEFALTKH